MAMEIKHILTDAKGSYYFGTIDGYSGDKHREAYLEASEFVLSALEKLFDKQIEIKTKENVFQVTNIDTPYFFRNLRTFLEKMYDSRESEMCILSERLVIKIYSDPVVVNYYYGVDKKEKRKIRC